MRRALRRRYGRSEVESVSPAVRQRALAFATAQYRHLRDFKVTPKKAYNETWKRLQRAAYGTHSEIGFIRYAHQISEIVHDAQRAVDER